jgi:hypothetical protein
MVLHLGHFCYDFWVLKFRGHFEALNDVFWPLTGLWFPWSAHAFPIILILNSNKILNAPNGYYMKTLHPWEVDASTKYLGARKPFGASPPRVRVLDLYSS